MFATTLRIRSRCIALILSLCGVMFAACSNSSNSGGPPEKPTEELYVLNERSNTLSVFTAPGLEKHGADEPLTHTNPHHLAFDHDHLLFFVIDRKTGGRVHKYDATTNELLGSSDVTGFWTGVAVDPEVQHVYVSDFGEAIQQRTKIYKLHVENLDVREGITAGSQPHFVEVTPDGNTVVATNAGSDEITLYYPNAHPDSNVTNVKIDPDDPAPFGQPVWQTYGLALSGDSLAYVSCRKTKSPEFADKAVVFVFDIQRKMTVDTILLPYVNRSGASAPFRLALCTLLENGRYLAVTTQDGCSVFLVDTQTEDYVERVFQTSGTFGVTATGDEKYIYVSANNGRSNPLAPGWIYELRRDGGNLTVTDSAQAGLLPNGCHVKHGVHTHE